MIGHQTPAGVDTSNPFTFYIAKTHKEKLPTLDATYNLAHIRRRCLPESFYPVRPAGLAAAHSSIKWETFFPFLFLPSGRPLAYAKSE